MVKGRDSGELADAILKLLENDELRGAMAAEARKRGLEHDWHRAFSTIWDKGTELL